MLINKDIAKSILCFMKGDAVIGAGVMIAFDHRLYACTCRHVIEKNPDSVVIDNKSKQLGKKRFDIAVSGFIAHKNKEVDIAISLLNIPKLLDADSDIMIWPEKEMLMPSGADFNKLGMGDTIFAIGFPLGLSGEYKNYPMLKGGFIARLDNECITKHGCFYVDCNAFPGNSGGPVFLKPEGMSIKGTEPINHGYLLGIVSAYLPYETQLINAQTNRIVSISEEHSGLSKVVPIHYAKEIYDEHVAISKTNTKNLSNS